MLERPFSMLYDASRASLYHPGDVDNFFQLGSFASDVGMCAEMARLAYVKDESRLRSYLNRVEFRLDRTIGYGTGGTQAFVASSLEHDLAIAVFRGTEPDDPSDIFTDAEFGMTPWTDDSGRPLGNVHAGFAASLLENDVLSTVKTVMTSMHPSARILLTGHSLGAALATLVASRLPQAVLYTYGSCRVGDVAFARSVQGLIHARFANCCDLVTRLPPETLHYVHSGSFFYIDSNGRVLESPNEDTINVDRVKAAAWYLATRSFIPGNVSVRDLADHSPINYVSGIMGIRSVAD